MFETYAKLYRLPGAFLFSLAGFIARFPMSFIGLSTLMLIRHTHGQYWIAGLVDAASIIGFAGAAPWLARLVDRHGQAQVMRPSLTVSILANIALITVALQTGPVWLLCILAAIAGAFSGSIGAMVRSRWSHLLEDPKKLKSAFALESALDELVFMLGPVLATALTASVHPASGLVLAILFALFGGMWFFSLKSTQPVPSKTLPVDPQVAERGSVMRYPALWAIGATFVGAGTLFGALDVSILEFTKVLGHPATSGIQLGIMAGGSLVGALIYGSRDWPLPLWAMYLAGMALLSIGVTGFLFAHTQITMGIIMFVAGLVVAPIITIAYSIVEFAIPRQQITEGLTWMNTFMNLGVALGSFTGGVFVDHFSYTGGLWVTAIASWFMFWIALATSRLIRSALGSSGTLRELATRRAKAWKDARASRPATKPAKGKPKRVLKPSDHDYKLTPAEFEAEIGLANPTEDVRRFPPSTIGDISGQETQPDVQ
ncbi:hypothetical protein BSR28_02005 [Boudabousia liubingyangii]|uniref:MFS transporter n=1 Tax=Boudabousia liubingyangii TaxID=1921764 RepID=UPI00093EDC4B|nr:MFS transporter [Boudabousia liubingyangii]OKL48490.1 hypothetical protein BSR28_02005 [Boudabousia liubingyangii]